MCGCLGVCVYIYIYIEREREITYTYRLVPEGGHQPDRGHPRATQPPSRRGTRVQYRVAHLPPRPRPWAPGAGAFLLGAAPADCI